MPVKIEKKKKESSLADKVRILTNLMSAFQGELSEMESRLDIQEVSIKKLKSRHGLA
jgi:hypothetical protein